MLNVRRADLHTHTYYSDGHLSPAELVTEAQRCGLSAIAITDHDCVDGLAEGQRAGAQRGIEVVAGVELSVTAGARRIHLLGYFFDPKYAPLLEHLDAFMEARRARAVQILERLDDLHVSVVLDFDAHTAVARPHIAEALVEAGYVASIGEAFMRYLGRGKPAYVASPPFPASKAVSLLHEAGGIGVLAHPGNYMASDTIRALVQAGLDGLETVHPSHDDVLTTYYRQLVRNLGLIETGGSDFHRPGDGESLGQRSIPYAWLTRARARRQFIASE